MNFKLDDIIYNTGHKEWGTWRVLEDHDYGFVIRGDSGSRVLTHAEAITEWGKAESAAQCSA